MISGSWKSGIATRPRAERVIIRDDGYDKLLTPLTFAYVSSGAGCPGGYPVRALGGASTDGGGAKRPPDRGAPCDGRDLVAGEIGEGWRPDFLKLLKKSGKVNLYGCSLAAATFEVQEADLIPEANGIVDSDWFLSEKTIKADHCQYF